jgi:phosphinothricin acetyltransferase
MPESVRDAVPDRDAAACAAIYAPSVDPGVASFELVPPDAAEMARRIADAHAFVVAEDDATVVGFAFAGPHHAREGYRFAVNVSVYVAPSHHRRGLGRTLYEALFERLRAQGLRWACAGITLPNPASVGLHEGLGFKPVGVYKQIGYKAGAWRDVGWWQLEL